MNEVVYASETSVYFDSPVCRLHLRSVKQYKEQTGVTVTTGQRPYSPRSLERTVRAPYDGPRLLVSRQGVLRQGTAGPRDVGPG